MSHHLRTCVIAQAVLLVVLVAGCVSWQPSKSNAYKPAMDATRTVAATSPLQPEIASSVKRNTDVITQRTAVASANPLASQAGLDILQAGGSAVDAAIAVQMVLGLVEPQSSGMGGGAFLLHSHGAGPTRRMQAFDGRETAPALADESLLLNAQGQPLPFFEAVVGGRSVGTPGVLTMLAMAHQQHGK